ncbi:MAG: DUF3800 domain-containing protein [Gemmataceae bacterium]
MYICYLDESGVQENANTSHFILLGMAIVAEEWKTLEAQTTVIKDRYGLRDAEIHAAWMARRFIEQEAIPDFATYDRDTRRRLTLERRKQELIRIAGTGTPKQLKSVKLNFRKTDGYTHLTLAERFAVLEELATLISTWTDARIFAEAVDKRVFYSRPMQNTPFERAFTEVVQRYENFLRHRGTYLGATLNGILVQDNNQTVAKRLTEMMRSFHRSGTRWTGIDHIIETPLFVDSHLTSMVQMADLCGYATRRFFENNERNLFDRIYPKFDRGGRGGVVGIRHFSSETCACRVCQDHT